MATPTSASIKAVLDALVYPTDTLSAETIFDFVRPRKRYPSVEIELSKPEGFRETKQRTESTYSFKISFYHKVLGLGGDEATIVNTIESTIITGLKAANLGDHKITNEIYDWSRTFVDRTHPRFIKSILTLSLSRIIETSISPDGILIFQDTGSEVDDPPGTDVTYLNVYDVEISEGYGSRNEFVSSNPAGKNIPVRYSTGFKGRFIGHLHIDKANITTDGASVSRFMELRTNGEKPIFKFQYTNKDSNTPPGTLTETCFVEMDEISRLYSHIDLTRYRITGSLTNASTIA